MKTLVLGIAVVVQLITLFVEEPAVKAAGSSSVAHLNDIRGRIRGTAPGVTEITADPCSKDMVIMVLLSADCSRSPKSLIDLVFSKEA